MRTLMRSAAKQYKGKKADYRTAIAKWKFKSDPQITRDRISIPQE